MFLALHFVHLHLRLLLFIVLQTDIVYCLRKGHLAIRWVRIVLSWRRKASVRVLSHDDSYRQRSADPDRFSYLFGRCLMPVQYLCIWSLAAHCTDPFLLHFCHKIGMSIQCILGAQIGWHSLVSVCISFSFVDVQATGQDSLCWSITAVPCLLYGCWSTDGTEAVPKVHQRQIAFSRLKFMSNFIDTLPCRVSIACWTAVAW